MLILKGNLLKFGAWMACLGLLLACSLACPAQAAPVSPHRAPLAQPVAPDVVAAEFYGWYLETLSADQDPLSDRYDTFTRYVSKALSARLVERLRSGKLPDSDYFIQSVDYRQAWLHSVRSALVRERASTAEVQVTLGKGGRSSRVLSLTMVLENGAWKIRTVGLAGSSFLKSSAEQPLI